MLLLTGWKTHENAAHWAPHRFAGIEHLRHRQLRTVRGYGMYDRREAPQYFPDARKAYGQ
jgi:hypothetical protein